MSFRKFVELIGSGEELATLDDTGTLQRRSVVDFRALIGLKVVYVRGASTANIASLSGALTHDGIVYATGDQILLKNQSTANQNGVYRINTAGAWTRSVEHDSSDEIRQRDVVCTADGTTNKMGYAWCCTNTGTITVGTTSITFAQYPVGIGTASTQAAAGNHSHTSIATTAASTFGASVGVRYASRTASASTASTDVSVAFSGSTANQVETMPDGTALSNNSGRVIIYSNRASVSWILRQAASNTLNGSSVDYVLPAGSWVVIQNNADNAWVIVASGFDVSKSPSLDGNNDFTGINSFSGATALSGGGTWGDSLVNEYNDGWSGKFGFDGNDGVSTSSLFHRPSNLEAIALTLYNPTNSSDSKRVFTVSCNDDSPNSAPVGFAFEVPVSFAGGETFSGKIALDSSTMLDMSTANVTLPDVPVGTLVTCVNTSTSDRTVSASSGTLICLHDHLLNNYTVGSWVFVSGGYLFQRVSSTRWVLLGVG